MVRKLAIAACLLLAACGDKVETVGKCREDHDKTMAEVGVANNTGFPKMYICHFHAGTSCDDIRSASRVDLLPDTLIHTDCEL